MMLESCENYQECHIYSPYGAENQKIVNTSSSFSVPVKHLDANIHAKNPITNHQENDWYRIVLASHTEDNVRLILAV